MIQLDKSKFVYQNIQPKKKKSLFIRTWLTESELPISTDTNFDRVSNLFDLMTIEPCEELHGGIQEGNVGGMVLACDNAICQAEEGSSEWMSSS